VAISVSRKIPNFAIADVRFDRVADRAAMRGVTDRYRDHTHRHAEVRWAFAVDR